MEPLFDCRTDVTDPAGVGFRLPRWPRFAPMRRGGTSCRNRCAVVFRKLPGEHQDESYDEVDADDLVAGRPAEPPLASATVARLLRQK